MKEINWKVPHYKQERNDTCGLACARMILGYFGFEVTEDEILEETFMHEMGSWYSDLAKPFLKRGLKTKISTINLNIYSPFWAGENEKKLKERLSQRRAELKGLLKTEVERAIEYIDLGGELEVKIPDTAMILSLLEKQPIMIPIKRSLIYPDLIDGLGHYVVLTGFDGENYTILDPASGGKRESEIKVSKEALEYGWLANNWDSDGYLLEIVK